MSELDKAFEALQEHPFTLISLADREKFHTGMLAFTINQLGSDPRLALLSLLWGEKACSHLGENETGHLRAFVEQNSIDLIVKKGNETKLWAEMKFKTTLGHDQIKNYQERHPDAEGALFALFTGVESLPANFRQICFHEEVVGMKKSILNGVAEPDPKTLIRLWIEYLEIIQILTKFVVGKKGNPIAEANFGSNLSSIKLKGIFEHYRHSVFNKALESWWERDTSRLARPKVGQFNTHGNAGFEHTVYPFIQDSEGGNGKGATNGKHLSYGLQWQGASLKLFVVATGKRPDKDRDKKLCELYQIFRKKNWVHVKPRKSSKEAEFKSHTIENWDIFAPKLDGNSATFDELAKQYGERLEYLASEECMSHMRSDKIELA